MRSSEKRSQFSISYEALLKPLRFQSRAFLLLPMCANVGVIIGPMLGGLTSDPAGNYPDIFGGITWLEKFPYSPPNLLSAIFLVCAAFGVFFGLEEVMPHFSSRLWTVCLLSLDSRYFRPERRHWLESGKEDCRFLPPPCRQNIKGQL